MGQAQINVRTRACSRTSIARTKQAALTHNVRGKELKKTRFNFRAMPIYVHPRMQSLARVSIYLCHCILFSDIIL